MSTPRVTIFMTTFNRERYIHMAIESIQKQSFQDWELLVLDDASSDNTFRVIENIANKDSRIQWIPTAKNLGITANRNRGFTYAKGTYIAVLDSDDLWINTNKLEKQVKFLDENPDCVVVGTQVRVIDEDGQGAMEFHYETSDAKIRRRMLWRNQFTHSGVLIRRSALARIPVYSTNIPIWEDYELWLHLGESGTFANLPEIMTAYRRHTGNISKSKHVIQAKTILQIIRKYRKTYPAYIPAAFKSYMRILRAHISNNQNI